MPDVKGLRGFLYQRFEDMQLAARLRLPGVIMKRILFLAFALAACGEPEPPERPVTLADASQLDIDCAYGKVQLEEFSDDDEREKCLVSNEKTADIDLGTVEVPSRDDGTYNFHGYFGYVVMNQTGKSLPLLREQGSEGLDRCDRHGKREWELPPDLSDGFGWGGDCMAKSTGEKRVWIKLYYAPDYPLPRSLLVDIQYRFTVTDATE